MPPPDDHNPMPIDPEGDTSDVFERSPGPAGDLPSVIGHYKIKRAIASGGMGTVYEATQDNPRRVVALKVMKRGLTSRSALRRFEYESQILARLRHPGIAQVYEAGAHDTGDGSVPYFAMEYVAGAKPVTRHARERDLDAGRRLATFVAICDAVHHGHQKGIIHRDLKPDNILVDSKGRPKIIDFGVARATDSDLAVTTLQTDVGQLVGTVQYMSPEQVEADPHDLDTRSDVYSLGVVLYELLTDRVPYDVRSLPIYEATRIVREQAPAPPSQVNRLLSGDLETIVLKAMDKDRERRYQSADELGRDVQRYLDGKPILARPPSLTYQLQVFARNNRALVTAALLVVAALVAGSIGTTVGMMRARQGREAAELAQVAAGQEAARARAVSDFLRRTLASANPILPSESSRLAAIGATDATFAGEAGRRVAAVDLLRQAEERLGEAFPEDPEIEAELRETLGDTFLGLGQYEAAGTQFLHAIGLHINLGGADTLAVARLTRQLSEALERQGESIQAELMMDDAIARFVSAAGAGHPETIAMRSYAADAAIRRGEIDRGIQQQQATLELARRELGPDHAVTLEQMVRTGESLWIASRFDESVELVREAIERLERTDGPDAVSVGDAAYVLSGALRSMNHLDEARDHAERALAIADAALGHEHPTTLTRQGNLGNIVMTQGDLAEAERLLRATLESQRRLLGPMTFELLTSANDLGVVLVLRGDDLDGAETLAREAWEGYRQVVGPETQPALNAADTLGMVLNRAGRPDEAETVYRTIIEIAERRELQDSVVLFARPGLATSLTLLSRFDEAEAELDLAAERADPQGRPEILRPWLITQGYIDLYNAWGKDDLEATWRRRHEQGAP